MKRLSILYLALPFFLFLFGWVRLSIAVPLAAIILYALWRLIKQSPVSTLQFPHPRIAIYYLMLTVSWLLLSGIGGYAFQNWDHHWRNAAFRDLILFDHPVYYTHPERGPINMLVYYVGYWLPSAWVGKLFGWGAANFALFLWSFLGVLLVTYHLASALKTSAFKATLLLIFFSGMDVLGALFFPQEYPTLLPPITHLETWAGKLQYSSFTTQLFWVFNQAIPAWLCIVLIHVIASLAEAKQSPGALEVASVASLPRTSSPQGNDIILFLWSLCFFFAPLASLGLLPYVLIELFKQIRVKSPLKNLNPAILLSAVIIFLLSAFFYAANTAAQSRGLQSIPLDKFLAFFLLEGGILWLALAPIQWRDQRWMVSGILLAVIPFIQIGSDRDFVMRASIAPLFYLMLMTGETIFNKATPRLALIACYSLLLIGSLTPLYEINRSIYRTYEYYFILDESQRVVPPAAPAARLAQPGALEDEHPGSLVADEIVSLQFMQDTLSKNFIANVRQAFYYRFIAKR